MTENILNKFKNRKAQISVIGLGYVGLPLALAFAEAGFKVVGIDKDKDLIENLKNGESPISDVGSSELMKTTQQGNIKFDNKYSPIKESEGVIICVPTPLTKYREPDTSYIEEAIENSLPYLHEDQLVILESTSYPGTTEELILPKLQDKGFEVGEDIYLAYSPERVDPGNKQYGFKDTPKVVGGITDNCTKVAEKLYKQVLNAEVHTVSSPKEAEMSKLLENIFRNVNIALVNELAQLADRMGIDIWEVIEAAKTKPYGFMPFYPGPGVGGHCIPVDPFYLSWKAKEYDSRARFIELAGEINAQMPEYVVEKLGKLLNKKGIALNGAKVLLLGVAYKKNVSDTRESPAYKLIKLLEAEGAEVSYHDPYVPQIMVDGSEHNSENLSAGVLKSADISVILTDHSNFDYDLIVGNSEILLDTRNVVTRNSEGLFKL